MSSREKRRMTFDQNIRILNANLNLILSAFEHCQHCQDQGDKSPWSGYESQCSELLWSLVWILWAEHEARVISLPLKLNYLSPIQWMTMPLKLLNVSTSIISYLANRPADVHFSTYTAQTEFMLPRPNPIYSIYHMHNLQSQYLCKHDLPAVSRDLHLDIKLLLNWIAGC